jgi:hypothetical protein
LERDFFYRINKIAGLTGFGRWWLVVRGLGEILNH